jgi:hypothetical protein
MYICDSAYNAVCESGTNLISVSHAKKTGNNAKVPVNTWLTG